MLSVGVRFQRHGRGRGGHEGGGREDHAARYVPQAGRAREHRPLESGTSESLLHCILGLTRPRLVGITQQTPGGGAEWPCIR